MTTPTPDLQSRMMAALNKLCKWRAVFTGWQLGSVSIENETARAIRDHRDATMLLRVEVNAMLQLMIGKGLFTHAEWCQQVLTEAELLDKAYEAKFPGFRTTADGVLIYNPTLAADTTRHWKP